MTRINLLENTGLAFDLCMRPIAWHGYHSNKLISNIKNKAIDFHSSSGKRVVQVKGREELNTLQ